MPPTKSLGEDISREDYNKTVELTVKQAFLNIWPLLAPCREYRGPELQDSPS